MVSSSTVDGCISVNIFIFSLLKIFPQLKRMALVTYCCISMIFGYSLVSSLILNTFSIRFVVLLASDSLARSSKFLLISASYLLF